MKKAKRPTANRLALDGATWSDSASSLVTTGTSAVYSAELSLVPVAVTANFGPVTTCSLLLIEALAFKETFGTATLRATFGTAILTVAFGAAALREAFGTVTLREALAGATGAKVNRFFPRYLEKALSAPTVVPLATSW